MSRAVVGQCTNCELYTILRGILQTEIDSMAFEKWMKLGNFRSKNYEPTATTRWDYVCICIIAKARDLHSTTKGFYEYAVLCIEASSYKLQKAKKVGIAFFTWVYFFWLISTLGRSANLAPNGGRLILKKGNQITTFLCSSFTQHLSNCLAIEIPTFYFLLCRRCQCSQQLATVGNSRGRRNRVEFCWPQFPILY